MSGQVTFDAQVEELKEKVRGFRDEVASEVLEETAERLEKLNYAPPVIIPLGRFLRLTRDTLLEEIDRLLALPDEEACALAPNDHRKCQDLRLEFISVQIFYYEKLMLLRQGDAETWDEIDELYVHD